MDILETLSAQRRVDAQEREKIVPYRVLEARVAALPGAVRDFAAAFSGPGLHVIAELKRASPSEGMIREDFRPEALARELTTAGAAALSVLCEPHRFLGDEAYLRRVRPLTEIPILYKDFVTTPYQIAEARLAGAEAVLLIAAVLCDTELRSLYALARQFGLRALVETHNEEEIGRAVDSGCEIIGVNCRDLRTFSTNVSLLDGLLGKIPSHCIRIAESGMHTPEALQAARAAGANGFLVGTALMRAEAPGAKLKELLGTK
ncbi:MAG: indole-3-glycerol phosphate synthase TrpC [Kiritimatiellia bacterium]